MGIGERCHFSEYNNRIIYSRHTLAHTVADTHKQHAPKNESFEQYTQQSKVAVDKHPFRVAHIVSIGANYVHYLVSLFHCVFASEE